MPILLRCAPTWRNHKACGGPPAPRIPTWQRPSPSEFGVIHSSTSCEPEVKTTGTGLEGCEFAGRKNIWSLYHSFLLVNERFQLIRFYCTKAVYQFLYTAILTRSVKRNVPCEWVSRYLSSQGVWIMNSHRTTDLEQWSVRNFMRPISKRRLIKPVFYAHSHTCE